MKGVKVLRYLTPHEEDRIKNSSRESVRKLLNDEYPDATDFEIEAGVLTVYRGPDSIAAYAPGHWRRATRLPDQEG